MNNRKDEKRDDPRTAQQRLQDDRGRERDAPLAPEQNRAPSEQHRGGPLPNQKK